MDNNKYYLKRKARLLNDVFNVYICLYLLLAVFYGANSILSFAKQEYIFAFILVLLWFFMKLIILLLIINIKNKLNQGCILLGTMTILLPFGELLAATVVVRQVVEFLSGDELQLQKIPK